MFTWRHEPPHFIYTCNLSGFVNLTIGVAYHAEREEWFARLKRSISWPSDPPIAETTFTNIAIPESALHRVQEWALPYITRELEIALKDSEVRIQVI